MPKRRRLIKVKNSRTSCSNDESESVSSNDEGVLLYWLAVEKSARRAVGEGEGMLLEVVAFAARFGKEVNGSSI